MNKRKQDLETGMQLAEQGDLDRAYLIADKYLNDDPNDVQFLVLMTFIMLGSHKNSIAYHLAKRATELAPKNGGVWMNMGMAANELWQTSEALRAYKKGVAVAHDDSLRSKIHVNVAAVLIDTGDFEGSEKHSRKALEYNPDSQKSVANLGFCQLAQRDWAEGWKNYRACIGSEWRPAQVYNDEPLWDGKGEGNIVVYAEQGLGDVISFGSMLPDMIEWCKQHNSRLIVDMDDRMENLFKRSFPEAIVYGTRGAKVLNWREEDRKVDYSLPMGQLGEYFRLSDDAFPGTRYLKPCPDRVLQWKALFKSKKKPVIGLSWTGGIPRTGSKFRQWDLEQLVPLLRSVDAHWVSLQYKPAGKQIEAFRKKYPDIDIVEYPHGTLTKDYDDTVAMVSALDQVVCMQTAVAHVAGALEVPCWVFVPKNSQWRYGSEGDDFPWAKSVRVIRQEQRGEWTEVIERSAGELSALHSRISKTAGKATRNRKVRRNRSKVRANGRADNRQAGDRPSA